MAFIAAFTLALAVNAGDRSAELEKLLDRPRTLEWKVSEPRLEDGSLAIRTEGRAEAVFRGSLEDFVGLFGAYELWPVVYERVASVRLLAREGCRDLIEMRSSYRVLGITFETVNEVAYGVERPGPGKVLVRAVQTGGDGSTVGGETVWELEEVSLGGEDAVLVLYRTDVVMRSSFPAQAMIMRGFGRGETERAVGELGPAVRRFAAWRLSQVLP